MPYPGAWTQPPDQWFTVHTFFGETWTNGSQDTPTHPQPTSAARMASIGVDSYSEALVQVQFTTADIVYHPPLPPGAVGVEYDTNGGPHGTTVTVTVTGSVSGSGSDMAATNFRVYNRPVTYSLMFGLFGPLWTDAPTLAGLTALLSYPLSATSFAVTPDSSLYTQSPAGAATEYSYGLVVATDRQVAGTPLATPGSGTDVAQSVVTAVTTAVYATPPRYRFLYDARPPLAHRQRRDGTDTAGPQLAHIGTAGGRPPLAWRQNTP